MTLFLLSLHSEDVRQQSSRSFRNIYISKLPDSIREQRAVCVDNYRLQSQQGKSRSSLPFVSLSPSVKQTQIQTLLSLNAIWTFKVFINWKQPVVKCRGTKAWIQRWWKYLKMQGVKVNFQNDLPQFAPSISCIRSILIYITHHSKFSHIFFTFLYNWNVFIVIHVGSYWCYASQGTSASNSTWLVNPVRGAER